MMTAGIPYEKLSDNVLNDEYHQVISNAYREMRSAFTMRSQSDGLSQDDIAHRLGVDKSLISRRLNGRENLTFKTLSQMATAMDHRMSVLFVPFESVGSPSNYFATPDSDLVKVKPKTFNKGPEIREYRLSWPPAS